MINTEEEYRKLEGNIKNAGLDEIGTVLFLDKYIMDNINYDNNTMDVEKAREDGNKELEETLIQKNKESCMPIDFFKNKVAVCGSISKVADRVLNDLGIETKCISGQIMMNNFAFGHMWNTVKINGVEYNCDFTHDMINNHYYDHGYEMAIATMSEPKSNVDYMFTKDFTPKRYIGGFIKDENGRIRTDERYKEENLTSFSDDFSNYGNLDKFYVQQRYDEVSKIYNDIYQIEENKKTI